MDHRKKNPNPNSSSAVPSAPSEESPSVGVKSECEKALNSLRLGNYSRALKMMEDAVGRHGDSSALLHRVHGTVAVKAASVLDDKSSKLRHLSAAVESARRAAELSPNSVEFAHFHANLLFEAASADPQGHGLEGVVQECERALSIADPVDPALESFQDDNQTEQTSPESRIAHVHQEIRDLIQKANIASISNWMKNISAGGNSNVEKSRLIPMRRLSSLAEDPIEMPLARPPRDVNRLEELEEAIAKAKGIEDVETPSRQKHQQLSVHRSVHDQMDRRTHRADRVYARARIEQQTEFEFEIGINRSVGRSMPTDRSTDRL